MFFQDFPSIIRTIAQNAAVVLLIAIFAVGLGATENEARLELSTRPVVLNGVEFDLTVRALMPDGELDTAIDDSLELTGFLIRGKGGELIAPAGFALAGGKLTISNAVVQNGGMHIFEASAAGRKASVEVRAIPGALSLAPPLLAILLALLFKEVLLSLFAGVYLGAVMLTGYNPLDGFLVAVNTYIVNALSDKNHAAVVLFSMCLGGMVGIMAKNGGMHGVVDYISKYAKSARSGQLATCGMGCLIFFDDYANTLLVGNTMRPFTDKLRISREKLSFIVDATAAPIASVAPISTWIGFQTGLIMGGFMIIGIDRNAYGTFISSVPYSFYAWLMLAFIVITAVRHRDYGPMLKAERRTRSTGEVLRKGAIPLIGADLRELELLEGTRRRWQNAMIPILFVIFATISGLYFTGRAALGDAVEGLAIRESIGEADSFSVLMWAAFGGAMLAGAMTLFQRILSLRETVDAYITGVRSMVLAMMILTLAWAIGDISRDLSTADYVLHQTRGLLSPHMLPVMTFLIAAFISFSTGTSWGTMAILTPIVMPMAYYFPQEAGLGALVSESIMLGTVAAVLSGSCFGDHCSPISDTTIMSSMASGADHIDHVRTQMPYALTVAGVAMLVGYIPAGFGINPFISIILGIAMVYGLHYLTAKTVEDKGTGSDS